MKNWGKVFMLTVILLIMSACGEKGESGVTVDPKNPYSWSELEQMINNSDDAYEGSRITNNIEEIEKLAKEQEIEGNSTMVNYIETLALALTEEVYVPIVKNDSDFDYYKALNSVKSSNDNLVDLFKVGGVMSYSDLLLLHDEMSRVTVNQPNETTYNNLTKIMANLDRTLTAIKERTGINPFYADASRIYYQYKNNLEGNKSFLSTNYSINLDEIDQTSNIELALEVLKNDIKILENETNIIKAPFNERNSLLSAMNELENAYKKYLTGIISIADVGTARNLHRSYETAILEGGGTVADYKRFIKEVYDQLEDLDTADNTNATELKTEFMKHIEGYMKKNSEYDDKNYIKIASTVSNIISELVYLKGKESELSTDLGLNIPW